jgi:antitoxin PrlF
MRVTSKGQVTIPVRIREELGIGPDCEVEFERVGDVVQLRKVASKGRGRAVVENLLRARYRGPSTEELLALTRGEE